MRYDAEMVVAEMVAGWLLARVDADVQAAAPVVTFFDPMSVDEENRILVTVPSVSNQVESPGNFRAEIDVMVKTRWTQATLADDFKAHGARNSEVRDKLMYAGMLDELNALAPAGLLLDFVQPKRDMTTNVFTNNWITSDMRFAVNGYFTTEN